MIYCTCGNQMHRDDYKMNKTEFTFCDTCGYPETQCGAPDADGEPSLDCAVCQLRDRLKERLDVLMKQGSLLAEQERDIARMRVQLDELNQEIEMLKSVKQ